jgi:hypothetical protein
MWILAGSLVVFLGACAAQKSGDTSGAPAASETTAAADVGVPPPPNSKLAKVHAGMGKTEVVDILGNPSGQNSYPTGKAFIPFYFGNDARRTSWYYKGLGRVVFADGNVFGGGTPEVMRVDYDPNETGIARE